jgi:PAS domain-containing protein
VTGSGQASALRDLRESHRLLESATLASLLLACAAAGVPWFLRVLPLEIGGAARLAFVYALVYLALARAAGHLARPGLLRIATVLLRAASLVVLAVVWHLLGGVSNPTLLLLFAVPVAAAAIAAGIGSALAEAAGAVVVVGAVALAESPELRWYLLQLGVPIGRSLPSLAPVPGASELFPGLAGQPGYLFALLAMFAVAQLGIALVAGALSRALRRRGSREDLAESARASVSHAFQSALLHTPVPTVVVFADTAEVVLASESFRQAMFRHGQELAGRPLFDLVTFSDGGRVRRAIEDGGELSLCPCRVGPESRVVQLRAFPFPHERGRLACITLEDRTDLAYLRAASEASDDAMLVIGTDERLRFANRAARDMLGDLHFGMPASEAWHDLNGAGAVLETTWEGERTVQAGARALQVSQSTLRLDGGSEVVRMMTLRSPRANGQAL